MRSIWDSWSQGCSGDTREALLAIAERLRREKDADALILGGTDLPLLLRGCEVPGLPCIDSARVPRRGCSRASD